MKQITESKEIEFLVDKFDLDLPKHFLEISGYMETDNGILITEIKIMDNKDKFKRKADLSKIIDHLSRYPVRFESRD